MPYSTNQPIDINAWGDVLESSLEAAGFRVGRKLMEEGGEQWWRITTQPRNTQLTPLSLDVGMGPAAGEFGRTIQLRSEASDWHAIMGPEIFYTEKTGAQLYTPLQNFVRYQQAAFGAAQYSPMFARTNAHEEFWKFATMGNAEAGLAGSIPRVGGPGASGRLAEDVAWWATIGYGSDVQDYAQARQNIYSKIQQPPSGPEGRLWNAFAGHAMFSEQTQTTGAAITRLEPAGIPLGGGNVLGMGTSAKDIIKRRSSTMGFGGTREQAFLYEQGAGGAWHETIPEYITNPTARGGYRYMNILYPGEAEPRPAVVQPGTMIRSGGLFPGGFMQYEDPIKGKRVAYASQARINLPSNYIPGYAEQGAQFQWGMNWKEGAPTRGITGAEVAPHSTVKIGQYTVPGAPGEEPISEDIWYTTGAAPVHFRGEPRLHFPGAYHSGGKFAGQGHSGVFPGRQPANVQMLTQAQQQAIMGAAGGIDVSFTSMMEPFVTIPTAKVTGGSVKGLGAIKAGAFRPGGLEQIAPSLREVQAAGGFRIPVTAVTGDLKASLPAFVATFGTMTNVQQQRALQQVYGGKVGQQLAGYVQGLMEQTDRPAAAVPLMGLAQAGYTAQGGEGVMPRAYGMKFWEQFRRGFRNLPATLQAEYGEAQLGAIYGEWHMRTPAEMRELQEQAMELYTSQGLSKPQAIAQFRQNIAVRRQPSGQYLVGSLATSRIGTIASGLAPEFMTDKPTKWGIDERAAVTAQYEDIARFLGVHTEMSPYQSGMRPPHVRAWDILSNVMGYNVEGSKFAEAYTKNEDYRGMEPPAMSGRIEMTQERAGELIRAMQGGAGLRELADVTRKWGQGPLYQPALAPGQQYLPQPGEILNVSESEYGREGGEFINRIARLYEKALPEFSVGSSEGQAKFQASLSRAITSRAGTTTKGRVASYLSQGFGGRYEQATGLDPGYAIIQQERLMNVMKQMAQQADQPWNKRTQRNILGQLEEQMRGGNLGAIGIRYPVLGQETGSVMMRLLTPKIAQEMFGLSQEETAGSANTLRVGASFYGRTVGDVDLDPITAAVLARFSESGKLEFPQTSTINAYMNRQQATGGDMLELAMGNRSTFNELQKAIATLGPEKLKGIGQTGTWRTTGAELRQEAEYAMGAKMGMGISFNLRRLTTAAAESIGFPGTAVSRGHTGGALSYQRYLDAVTSTQGGMGNIERMMQTLYVKSRKGVPVLGAMIGEDKWATFGTYNDNPKSYQANLQRGMGSYTREAIISDIVSGHTTPAAAALMLGQPGVADPRVIEEALKNAGNDPAAVAHAVMGVMNTPGYDITATTIGTAMFSRLSGKIAQGTMRDPTGAQLPLLPEIGMQGIPIGGQVWRFGELEKAPQLAATSALYKQYTGKQGTLLPSEVEAINRNFQRIEGITGGLSSYAMQAVMSAYGPEAVESIKAARQRESNTLLNKGVLRLPEPGGAQRARRENVHSVSAGGVPVGRKEGYGGKPMPFSVAERGNVGQGNMPPGGGGIPPGAPPTNPNDPGMGDYIYRMYVQHLGASKEPAKILADYSRGVESYQRMFGSGSAGEQYMAQTAQIQRFIQQTLGPAYGPSWFEGLAQSNAEQSALSMFKLRSALGESVQKNLPGFRQLFAGRGGQLINAGSRAFQNIQRAAQAQQIHGDVVGQISPEILRRTGIAEWDITEASSGMGPVGVEANLYGMVRDLAREQGVTSRSGAMATEGQATSISRTSKEFIDSLKDFTKHINESKEAMKGETLSRKQSKELMEEQRQVQMKGIAFQRAQLAPEISALQTRLQEETKAGAGPEVLSQLRGQLGSLYERQVALSKQEIGLMAQGRGKSPGEILKSLTGGWNVMYMKRMLGLGVSQFQQGYSESEQFMQGTSALARRQFGAEVGAYTSPEMAYQTALLRSGGSMFRSYRQLSASMSGAGGLSDIAGAGMTGIGITSLAGFVGTTMANGGGAIGALGGALSSAALPLGMAAAGVGLLGSQYSYYKNQGTEVKRVAAAQMGGRPWEAAGGVISKLLFPSGWQSIVEGMPREATGVGQYAANIALQEQMRSGGIAGATTEELTGMAETFGMSGLANGIPAALATELGITGIRRGLTTDQLVQMTEKIGGARLAGLPTQQGAAMEAAARGLGPVGPMKLQEIEERWAGRTEKEIMQYQAGYGMMLNMPGMQFNLQGRGGRYADITARMFANVAGGPYEQQAAQMYQVQQQRRTLGATPGEIDLKQFYRTSEWSPQNWENYQQLMIQEQAAAGLGQQLAGAGVTGFNNMIFGGGIGQGMALPQIRQAQMAISGSPITLTQMAMQGQNLNQFALSDINLQGQMTGLGWGTTSLAQGSMTGAQVATNILGADYKTHPGMRAAVEGVMTPTGERVGGMRAIQWAQTYAQRGYQSDMEALNAERQGLSTGYMHQIWAVQDRQTALNREQAGYGYEMQQRQFALQGEQFFEQRGLTRRSMLNRRQWQMQDRAYEDQVSALQWQWQTEDYQENIRFMTGRQRRTAERSMQRATTMRGLQTGQRERTRGRQDEIYAIQEEQFKMQKEHWEENRELIEENMKKQREFYLEGQKLQDEMTTAQRKYWEANNALTIKATELQKDYRVSMEQLEDAGKLINQYRENETANMKKLMELDIKGWITSIMEAVAAQNAQESELRSMSGGYAMSRYGTYQRQSGGDVMVGNSYLVGETSPEVMRPGMIGSVATMADVRTASRMHRDRWGDSTVSSSASGRSSGGQQSINIYIGSKKIKEFIVDTISQELEVH